MEWFKKNQWAAIVLVVIAIGVVVGVVIHASQPDPRTVPQINPHPITGSD